METSDTFFKVYRKLFENGLWKTPVPFRLFIWLLGQTVYTEKGVSYGSLKINRGQYLRSYRKLQEDLEYIENNQIKRYPLSTIKRAVDLLKELEIITTDETGLGTLFTLVNYNKYQSKSSKVKDLYNSPEENKSELETALETKGKHSMNNTKKVKKEKEFNSYSDEYRLSNLLLTLIQLRNPNHKQPNLKNWSEKIDQMIRIDNRSIPDIEAVIHWCQKDKFWQNNILSTEKLREKFDTLLLKMKAEAGSEQEHLQIYQINHNAYKR